MAWLNSTVNTINGVLNGFALSWVDFVTLLIICIGVVRGRKRGLSEELLDVLQWLCILVAGAFFYQMLADMLNIKPIFSQVTYRVISYILIALVLKIVFTFIKKRFGQKLVESDMFGRVEFYGGMAAGALRWTCMYFFLLSLLHAPHYSEAELAQRKRDVEYNYGSDFFPAVCKIQDSVFKESLTGTSSQKYLAQFLIAPGSIDSQALRGDNSLARRRERDVDAVMGGK
jgi:uncharacterized membrane protein required for colicin V production